MPPAHFGLHCVYDVRMMKTSEKPLLNADIGGRGHIGASVWLCAQLALLALYAPTARAADSLCATVKIEILQELTLERQAFDARMKINNGLDTIALQNVDVTVQFADDDGNPVSATSDPNDTSALFFIRLDSMDGISDVSGGGTVAPASAAEIHWLIIPAAGAAGNQPQGKRYQVGATLHYTMGGEPKDVDVVPDWITVTPQPRLVLDYFLTKDVFADDPFTPLIEPPEPFTLGVRVRNNGFGVARSVAIDSAQPKIVENDLGLLIGFVLTGSFVDDQPAAPTLRIGFGDIAPQTSRVGRWVMETTLSGKFTEFSAQFSHADSLGGRLTSLIDTVNTHFLVRDVRVDLPDRDHVRDFLALDGDTLRVYESDSVDTAVTDQSSYSSLSPLGGDSYLLSTPLTSGMLFVRLPDPYAGTMEIRSVLRADGKLLPSENAWTSKTGDGHVGFQHFVNFFDVNGGGQYTVQLGLITAGEVPPVLQFIPDRTTMETQRISFIVEATDANGTIPSLGALNLPAGATFVDQGNGVGIFDWAPTEGQAGSYPITYRASDGALSTSRTAIMHVNQLNTSPTPGTPPVSATDTPTPYPTATPSQTATTIPSPTGTATASPTPTPTATPAPQTTLWVGRLGVHAGQAGVVVSVTTSDPFGVGSTDLVLTFDLEVLQGVSCSSSTLSGFVASVDNTAGEMRTGSVSGGGDTLAAGAELFHCVFNVRSDAPLGPSPLGLLVVPDGLVGVPPPSPPASIPYAVEEGRVLVGAGEIACSGPMSAIDASVLLCRFVGRCQDSDFPGPCSDPALRVQLSDWDCSGTLAPIDASITLAIVVGRIHFEDTALVQGCGGGGGGGGGGGASVFAPALAGGAAAVQPLDLEVSDASGRPGDVVSVEIRTRQAVTLGSTDLMLRYDRRTLEALSAESATLSAFTYGIDNRRGLVRTASATGEADVLEAGATLFRVTFRAQERGRRVSSLRVLDGDGVGPPDVAGPARTGAAPESIPFVAHDGSFRFVTKARTRRSEEGPAWSARRP